MLFPVSEALGSLSPYCYSLFLKLSGASFHTRFTVGRYLSLLSSPVSLLVLYGKSPPLHPFHCWFCTERTLSPPVSLLVLYGKRPSPLHPFHCWASRRRDIPGL